MLVAPGSTSVSVDVQFLDDTGAAVTGKAAADFPACKWSGGSNVASTTITLSDLSLITTAHPNDNTAGGIKEREGGWYRLDLPNNMFTSAGRKTLTFAETTNKRILAPTFDVQYAQTNLIQAAGVAWASGAITRAVFGADTGLQTARSGTAQAGGSSTITLDSGASSVDGFFRAGSLVYLTGGTGVGQAAVVSGYVGSTKVLTVDTPWVTNPDNTTTFAIFAGDSAGVVSANVVQINGDTQSATDLKDFADTGYDPATHKVAGLTALGFTLGASDLASGIITAAKFATDAIDSNALATSAVQEIRNAITGGAYALNTDANGSIRIVDGTGTGEIDTSSGTVTVSGDFSSTMKTSLVTAIWDGTLSGHTTSGTFGAALNAASSAGDPWATLLPGSYGAGTAGLIVGTYLDAAISGRATNAGVWSNGTRNLTALGFTLGASDLASGIITAAKFAADAIDSSALATSAAQEIRNAVTGGAYALNTDANGSIRIVDGTGTGEIDTNAGAIAHVILADTATTLTNAPADSSGVTTLLGRVTGSVALHSDITALNNLSTAQVLAQVETALATTTRSMPGQATPSATPTLAAAIMQLFQQGTNPTNQTSSQQSILNRAGDTVHQKRTVSDDGTTFSLGAVATGP